MKYKLLKELPFMRAGVVFEKVCKDRDDCCVFGFSYHNCVKHYNTIQFSDNENETLCGIIDNPDWIEVIVPEKVVPVMRDLYEITARSAVKRYDDGLITYEQLIDFIEAY